MMELDIDRFWADDELAHKDNCFSKSSPQVALGIRMSNECVFAELNEPGEPWGHTPRERRIELNRRYNEKALRIVGRRLLTEDFEPEDAQLPTCRQIGEIFGGEYVFDGKTTWLKSNMSTPEQLEKQLDVIDRMDLESFIFPDNWHSEKNRIFEMYGKRPQGFQSIRGPVTLATSTYGIENLIYLIYDEPDLAKRFRDTIMRVVLEYVRLFGREAGYEESHIPHGFYFNDDDCCLLTPDMYEFFGYPVLKAVFDKRSPDPGDTRFQHSDSAMGHLLPILARLHLTGCNFGPTVMIDEIRKHMPKTRIDGQLAPFTFMNNNKREIINEVKRDCEMARKGDMRGVNICTAGSINNGSLLESMRVIMATIQNYGRY